jgi:hypothetical protein
MRVHVVTKGTGSSTHITDLETGEELRHVVKVVFEPIVAGDLVRCALVTRGTIDAEAEVIDAVAECGRLREELWAVSGRLRDALATIEDLNR